MIKVVLIDDHSVITDGLLVLISSDERFSEIKAFNKPKDAISYLDTNEVDVIITDLDMPEMNGEDVLSYCKLKFPQTKVIVLSMHDEKSIIRHLIELGADGYLIKSAGKEDILRAIDTVQKGAKYFSDDVMQSLMQRDAVKTINQDPKLNSLTSREIEIIKLISAGHSSKEIGEMLFISPRTAETHRSNILKKLEVNGIAGIIRFAFQNELIK